MVASTRPKEQKTDENGIERIQQEEDGLIDKYRKKYPLFDHIMRMRERYSVQGGDQYAAAITYFSVLSLFPILMLAFAIVATILANRPEVVTEIQAQITASMDGSLGETVNGIIDTAIDQRGAVAGIGGITALFTGLGWMSNLKFAVSKIWKYPVTGGTVIQTYIRNFLALVGLGLALGIAFAITAVGSSGLTYKFIHWVHLENVPGIGLMVFVVTILLGLVANFLVFLWMMKTLPSGPVPLNSALQASAIGAVAFEIFKQLGSVFFSNALSNPAGATFGSIIGIMVLFYFIWRIVLYCSAWAATTPESLALEKPPVPAPAVIRVRSHEPAKTPAPEKTLGLGMIIGFVFAAILSLFRRRK